MTIIIYFNHTTKHPFSINKKNGLKLTIVSLLLFYCSYCAPMLLSYCSYSMLVFNCPIYCILSVSAPISPVVSGIIYEMSSHGCLYKPCFNLFWSRKCPEKQYNFNSVYFFNIKMQISGILKRREWNFQWRKFATGQWFSLGNYSFLHQ